MSFQLEETISNTLALKTPSSFPRVGEINQELQRLRFPWTQPLVYSITHLLQVILIPMATPRLPHLIIMKSRI